MEYAIVGKPQVRLDGVEKATGQARYGADIFLPGMLWGRVLRSPHAHARIVRSDTSKAERLPGVKAVVTATDVREGRWGNILRDELPLARHKVLWVGDRVAAVAATTPEIAREALDLIEVAYEPLPAVFDPLEALKPEAPILHEDLASYRASFNANKYGNVCTHIKIEKGNIEEGFAQADIVLEDTFGTPMANQAALEPSAMVAAVDHTGKLTVWVTTQAPFGFRSTLADILGIPMTKLRIIATHVGGGFGGKGAPIEQAWVALLALKSRRPVKAVYDREEDFTGGRPRHPSMVTVKLGAKRDGTLVAGQGRVIFDSGAMAVHGPVATSTCCRLLFSPYRIPNVKVEGYVVYTNKPGCGAMRAPGSPQACFAIEQMMDMVAEKIGMDPVALRLKNAVAEGDLSPTGQRFERIGLRETIERARDASAWGSSPAGNYRGRGFAVGEWHTAGGAAACQVKINPDGTATVLTGSVEIGQGSTTVIAQMVAEELGVALEDLTMITADTDVTPHDTISAGSSVTHRMGNAARRAAADARQQLLRMAAQRLEANVADLEARERRIYVKGSPEKSVAIADLARASYAHGSPGPILGRGSFFSEEPPHDPRLIQGSPRGADIAPSFISQVADVEVDPETGQVKVLRLIAAQDVGQAINPLGVEGQMEGGALMGVGFALMEKVHLDDKGNTQNPNFLDYKIPTVLDQPPMDPVIVEVPTSDGPFGARGVGEPPIIAVAPAIANAVYQAVGVRIKELPLSGERILAALRARQKAAS